MTDKNLPLGRYLEWAATFAGACAGALLCVVLPMLG
jgi:hypothetical protein